uniref:Uncharacterized protein n=1 Tax=Caenorhabditis tropicalis TaxID=1561998 RepID=A0A1I7V0T5_9PELO
MKKSVNLFQPPYQGSRPPPRTRVEDAGYAGGSRTAGAVVQKQLIDEALSLLQNTKLVIAVNDSIVFANVEPAALDVFRTEIIHQEGKTKIHVEKSKLILDYEYDGEKNEAMEEKIREQIIDILEKFLPYQWLVVKTKANDVKIAIKIGWTVEILNKTEIPITFFLCKSGVKLMNGQTGMVAIENGIQLIFGQDITIEGEKVASYVSQGTGPGNVVKLQKAMKKEELSAEFRAHRL